CHVVRQWREIIETISVWNELSIGHVLGNLFVAAMQITYIECGPVNDLAIQLQNNAEHAMSCWMGRPHVEHHLIAVQFLALRRHRSLGRRLRNFNFASSRYY